MPQANGRANEVLSHVPSCGSETQDLPFQVTYGYSKDKRPDLKQFVLSTLCVDRAVPIWGKLDDGNASDKTLNTPLLSELARLLADHGVRPGAYIYIADAALVTEDTRLGGLLPHTGR
jgi:transposase